MACLASLSAKISISAFSCFAGDIARARALAALRTRRQARRKRRKAAWRDVDGRAACLARWRRRHQRRRRLPLPAAFAVPSGTGEACGYYAFIGIDGDLPIGAG